LLIKWILKASGLFEADSVFLIEKGACVVVKDIVFHLEEEMGRAPKCVANAFVYTRVCVCLCECTHVCMCVFTHVCARVYVCVNLLVVCPNMLQCL